MTSLKSHFTLRKLVFYLVFWGLNWGLFAYGWYEQASDSRLAGLNTLHYSVWISRGSGLTLSFDVTVILLPMCRNLMRIVRPRFKWLPLDRTQWFHRQVAYTILLFTTIHVCCHYVNFYNVEKSQIRPERAVQIHYTQAGGITGHIMLLCMLLMYTTAHHRIRQQSYETFWYTHHLFIPFLLAMYTHATGCFVRDTVHPYSPFVRPFWKHCIGYQGWRWELFAFAIYLTERVYREIRCRRETKITQVIRHPYNTIEVRFNKPSLKYKVGQWVFIQVPNVSSQQWHPFTITSCPFDAYISIHVQQVGDFTRALGDALGCGPLQDEAGDYDGLDPKGIYEVLEPEKQVWPVLKVDGPYGTPAEDVLDNEVAVLIGTGIGVTPWASVLKNIYNLRASNNSPRRLKRVEFIWINKHIKPFEWFHTLLSSLEEQSVIAADELDGPQFLKIHTYLTQTNFHLATKLYLNNIDTEFDPMSRLRTRMNFGRPNFKRIFGAMKAGIVNQSMAMNNTKGYARTRTKVGVYFCGPGTVARDIKTTCSELSDQFVKFEFWKEQF